MVHFLIRTTEDTAFSVLQGVHGLISQIVITANAGIQRGGDFAWVLTIQR
ncbi:MAG: hypothetical protein GY850_28135 [bacterium]|nr:hypothetical protein [bacterium]